MSILSVSSDNRKSIFIASSSESLDIARAVKANFDHEADVDIWNENIFALNKAYLTSLLDRSSFYDYAIIILSKDDKTSTRGEEVWTPRDNALFEFGLFMGRIGPERAFTIAEEGVKLLTDFAGIHIPTFRKRDNLVSAVGNACEQIRKEMQVSEKSYRFTLLPSTSLAIGYYKNFIEKVLHAFETMNEYELFERNELNEKINVQKRKIKNRVPVITILLPNKLSNLKAINLNHIAYDFTRVTIESKSRQYPFYLDGNIKDEDNLNFFDIPTTLLSSLETIEKLFDGNFLERDNIRECIERREIANFEKTLRKLLKDNIENETIKFEVLKSK